MRVQEGRAPVRYAEWRFDPKRASLIRHEIPERFRRLPLWKRIAGLFLLIAALPLAVFFSPMLAVLPICVGPLFLQLPAQGVVARRISYLAPLPLPEDHYVVEVSFFRDDLLYGSDVGVVGFVEGWLVFEGFETSFSVNPLDCDGFTARAFYGAPRPKPNVDTGSGTSSLAKEHQKVVFHAFDVVDTEDGILRGRQAAFETRFRRWTGEEPVEPGTSLMPPLRVHPRVKQWHLMLNMHAAVTFGWASIVFAIHGLVSSDDLFDKAWLPSLLLITAVVSLVLGRRAWKKTAHELNAIGEGQARP